MSRSLTTSELRRLSAAELEQLGQESLREHLVAQAAVANARYGPLSPDRLDQLLRDPDCLRHPTRIVYEFGEMALHQFAQPDLDPRDPSGHGRVLYLRPALRDRPDCVVRAAAYMIPVINYGPVITDDHCVAYGAALLGESPEQFYASVCGLADTAGAETRLVGESGPMACPAR